MGATTCREVGARRAAQRRLGAFVDAMLERGVLLSPSRTETISTPTGDAEIEHLLAVATAALVTSTVNLTA